MENIITIKNLGKKYNIKHQQGGYVALRDVLTYIIKKPFSFLKHKTKQIIGLEKTEEFWALKNIDLQIKKGEVVGIIGANGAGKSTLLKILSQITPPTTGEIEIDGSVGSLLEVGTGFHPELSGRENILLNGAILGMTKKEIAKKFNAIMNFAGIEKFLDTPVKYYSSGMYVRLAFSVAAHMEPDILVVDEVLAVGDDEFQKKCLGKMSEITKNDGRTILFVSHNMNAIEKLCNRCVLLKQGQIVMDDKPSKVIDYYLNKEAQFNASIEYQKKNNEFGQISKITILNKDKAPGAQIPVSEYFYIKIDFEIYKLVKEKTVFIYFYSKGEILFLSSEADKEGKYRDYEPGKYTTTVKIPAFLFEAGVLYFDVVIRNLRDGKGNIDYIRNINIELLNINNPRYSIYKDNYWGKLSTILEYSTEKNN